MVAPASSANKHDPKQASLLVVERELARRHLLSFATFVNPKYERTRAHEYLSKKLEQVEKYILSAGKEGIGRLMIFMPPRHGKTELMKLFQAWLLGRNPDIKLITTSYSADLANDNSRAVRDILMSKPYATLFGNLSSRQAQELPVQVSEEARSIQSWSLKAPHKGGMLAAGVGGGITGRGAHLLTIDDPFKNRDEASSDVQRKRVLQWYRSTAYTRLEKGGAVVLINTRWDQDDLSGALLNHMVSDEMGDTWEVVFLPAFALDDDQYPRTDEDFRENLLRGIYIPMGGDQIGRQAGEALWAEKYDRVQLERIHSNTMDFEFAAQYQQMPRLADGNFFDEKDFGYVEHAPEGLQWFRYIDLALGKTEQSDFNATAAVAMDGKGVEYIRDMIKERDLDLFLGMVKAAMLDDREQGTIWAFEDNAFQSLVVKQFMADKSLAKVNIMGVTRTNKDGDKTQWAQSWRLRAKQGLVKLVRGAWNLSFLREATAFPNGRHDDEIDTVSGGNQLIAEGAGGTGKTVSAPVVMVSAEELFGQMVG